MRYHRFLWAGVTLNLSTASCFTAFKITNLLLVCYRRAITENLLQLYWKMVRWRFATVRAVFVDFDAGRRGYLEAILSVACMFLGGTAGCRTQR